MLMASQAAPSSQAVPGNKQTLLTKSLQARAASTGQCSPQTQSLNVAGLSHQQVRPSFSFFFSIVVDLSASYMFKT